MTGYVFWGCELIARIPVFDNDDIENNESVLNILLDRLPDVVQMAPTDSGLSAITGKEYIKVFIDGIHYHTEKDGNRFEISTNPNYSKWKIGWQRSCGL